MASTSDDREGDGRVIPVTGTLQIPVYNKAGESVGSVELDPADFGGKINKQLMHDVVIMYRANQRAGTHSTLRRGEVSGSTKKLFRQKGTGNARVGTRRTNKRRGGGTAKGPKPRDYSYTMPKKAVRLSHRMAVLSKFADGEALIVDDLSVAEVKTKAVVGLLKALKLDETTSLIGTAELDRNLYLSARNIPGVKVLPAAEFNTYAVLRHKRLVLSRAAFDALRERAKQPLKKKPEAAAATA